MQARCRACEQSFQTDRAGPQTCPICGAPVDVPAASSAEPPRPAPLGFEGGTPAGGGFLPPPGEEPRGRNGADAPFDRYKQDGFVETLVETWKRASLQPNTFFATLRPDGVGPAYLYAFAMALVGGLGATAWGGLFSLMQGSDFGALVAQIFFFPIGAAVGVWIWAGVLHLSCAILGINTNGFEATFRAIAYAQGPAIFGLIPGIGSLVGGIWTLVLSVIALTHLQKTTTGKAILAVFLPSLVLLMCCCFAASLGAFGLGAFGSFLEAAKSP